LLVVVCDDVEVIGEYNDIGTKKNSMKTIKSFVVLPYL